MQELVRESTEEEFLTLKKKLMQQLAEEGFLQDEEVLRKIDEFLRLEIACRRKSVREKQELRQKLFASIRKLDILQELLDDPEISEIMVNGPSCIFIEKNGKLERWPGAFPSRERLEDIMQTIVAGCNRVINETVPLADARLPGGERVHLVIAPVALDGPVLTIRRFRNRPITMSELVSQNALTREAADFLRQLVEARYSIMISGGTSAGKTTFLNALSAYIPPTERIITIEDTAELQLMHIDNLVRLESKRANLQENTRITIRDLIRASLRMRPDRIIVGEVRGEEAIDLLQALNTGHEGSLSTAHANSPEDMIYRLETMVLMGMHLPLEAIRRQIVTGIHIFVQLERNRSGRRQVTEITEIAGYEGGEVKLHELFKRDVSGQSLKRTGELLHREKLIRAGF